MIGLFIDYLSISWFTILHFYYGKLIIVGIASAGIVARGGTPVLLVFLKMKKKVVIANVRSYSRIGGSIHVVSDEKYSIG